MILFQLKYMLPVVLYIYIGHVATREYYVSSSNGAPSHHADLPCNNLSFYSADYFTNDTIFYFLEGTHILQNLLMISGVSNLTLQGLGNIQQGFHETVMQSTSVIKCIDYFEGGIVFISSKNITLKFLTIANCGFKNYSLYLTSSLRFIFTNNVTIEWVSVQNSSDWGLFLFNTFDVAIINSSFAQNKPRDICSDCIGGNALINYNLHTYQDTPTTQYKVYIVQSNFTLGINLQACIKYENNMLEYGISSGGLAIIVHLLNVLFYIDSVVFFSNSGAVGANFYFSGRKSNYSLIMNNSISIYGQALTSYAVNRECTIGAGMYFEGFSCASNNPEIIIEDVIISHNVAELYGGGMSFIWHEGPGSIKVRNCIIYNNTGYYGSGFALYGIESAGASISYPTFHFANLLIDSNQIPNKGDQYQAAINIMNINNVTFEHIEVRNHHTNGLVSLNSLLTFTKDSTFENNSGSFGGGIALYDSSHLIFKEQMSISFINNHASQSGGGIFTSQLVGTHIPNTCFYEVTPYNANAKLYFVNNTADISGDVLYGGNIDYCLNNYDFHHLFNYTQQTGLSVVSSDPIQVCFCESERQNCSIKSIKITSIPGIGKNISLAIVGSKHGLTQGVIKLTDTTFNVNIMRLDAACSNVTYVLKANDSLNTTKVYATLENSIIKPITDPMAKLIEVIVQSCPSGFPLINGACVCRSELATSPEITCDINTQIISRDGNLWIGYENVPDCLILYQNCPFNYCNVNNIQFKITSSDPQCLLNRSGILCGQCAEGLSLKLGSNRCGECTDYYLVLIIPFALAGIALVAFLIALNLTVSVGTINGLIFYANVIKIYEPIFFPHGPVPFLTQFISWLNLDLGIETCFFNGMDSCIKTGLQFVFPIYVWFLLIVIILLAKYSNKVVQLVGRHAVPVLATMILLSYTKIIRTVFQAFYYTNIQCTYENDVIFLRKVWKIDANVQYMNDHHLPLFVFSLSVLVLLVIPYTCFLLTISLFERWLSNCKCCKMVSAYMKPFFDAYGGPYKDKCRFWTGFLLLVRVFLALVVSLDSKATVSLYVLICTLIGIVFIHITLKGTYARYSLAVLEVSFILNLILLAHLNNTICTKILISVVFLVFCLIIIYHIWDRLLKSRLQQTIKKIKGVFKKPELPSNSNEMELPRTVSSTSVFATSTTVEVVMKRESLIQDEDDNP